MRSSEFLNKLRELVLTYCRVLLLLVDWKECVDVTAEDAGEVRLRDSEERLSKQVKDAGPSYSARESPLALLHVNVPDPPQRRQDVKQKLMPGVGSVLKFGLYRHLPLQRLLIVHQSSLVGFMHSQ